MATAIANPSPPQYTTQPNNNVNVNLQAALGYVAQGRTIVPLHESLPGGGCTCRDPQCGKPAKHPRIKWKKPDDGLTTEKQVRDAWRRWPNAGVGILTGARSGVWVLDIDPGHDGLVSLAKLFRQFGPLPETRMARSGSGGKHYYFRCPDGVAIKTASNVFGPDYPGLDVRGDGGLIVAPPSRHASGARYAWVDEPTPIADAPAWLVQLVADVKPEPMPARTQPSAASAHRAGSAGGDRDRGAYWLDKAMARTGAGVGDATGLWLAQQMLLDPDVNDAEAFDVGMRYAAAATVDPRRPFTEWDVRRWLASAAESDIVRRGEPARAPERLFTATPRAHREPATHHDGCAACAEKDAQIAELKAANRRLNERLQWIDEVMATPSATLSPSAKCTLIVFRRENERDHRRRNDEGMWKVWLGDPDPQNPGGFAELVGLSESTVSKALQEDLAPIGAVRCKTERETRTIRDRKGNKKDIPVDRLYLDAGPLIDSPKVWQRPDGPRNQGGTRAGAGRPKKACPQCGGMDVVVTQRTVTEIHCRDCGQDTTERTERYTYDSREEMQNQVDSASDETPMPDGSEINLPLLTDAASRTGNLISDAPEQVPNQLDSALRTLPTPLRGARAESDDCQHEYANLRTPDGRRICIRCDQPELEREAS